MKRYVLVSLLALLLIPSYSFAHGWGHGGYGYRGYGGYWGGAVAAGVLGGFATGAVLGAFAPWPGYYPAPAYYGPWGYPYYSYPGPYYQSAPVAVQQPGPVYQQAQQAQPQYWYWCDNPQGYYPYIQNCPSNWKQVVPQIAPPNR
jgi:hypothetical protein